MDPGLAGGVEWRPVSGVGSTWPLGSPVGHHLANFGLFGHSPVERPLLGAVFGWASAADARHARASSTLSTSIEVKQARDLRKVPLVG
jgi:hypothetical protein